MVVYVDYQGRRVRLTQERLAHILEHLEMTGMELHIPETLLHPEMVKMTDNDAFILTAYLVTRPAGGKKLWPKDE